MRCNLLWSSGHHGEVLIQSQYDPEEVAAAAGKNQPRHERFCCFGSVAPPLLCRQNIEQQLGSLILATDISRQNEFLSTFREHLESRDLDLQLASHRHFILQVNCPPSLPPYTDTAAMDVSQKSTAGVAV